MNTIFLPCTRPTIDPDTFFPATPEELAAAQAVCATCTMTTRCLADALRAGTTDGVWGGVLLERGQIIAQKRRAGRPRKSETVAA
ncbi:MAG: WhiB family transcriptional regulator [Pseudonocardiales bacterium]|nr:MAG: WhiB family transcriptional regulator [Pseudonocardiales bacterium]